MVPPDQSDDAEQFVAAALEPSRWPAALARLAELTGSDFAQLIGFGPDFNVGFNWVSGDGAALTEIFDPLPPSWNFRVEAARLFPDEAVIDERHYQAVIPRLSSPTYVELAERHGIRFGCQADLRNRTDGVIGLALLRSMPTQAAQRALFDRIRIDVAAAISLQIALEQEGYRLIAGTFEAMAGACFVLDRAMRVRALTPAAETLVSNGLFRLTDDRLSVAAERDGGRFARALRRVADGEAGPHRVILPAFGSDGATGIELHRLPRREWDLGFSPFALVTATPPARPAAGGAGLREAFGLTGAEAEIAALLAAGQSRAEICARRRISAETMRSHLRAIFAKLGVRREAELIHLLARING